MIQLNGRQRINQNQGSYTVLSSAQTRNTVTAATSSMSSGTSASGNPVSKMQGGGANVKDSLMDGIIKLDTETLLGMYLDMYAFDPTVGGAIDLKSILAWSGLKLSGYDEATLDPFYASLERMNIEQLMPEISLDQNVLGTHISTPVYNENVKGFTDIIPHSIANCEIEDTPMYSQDPIITLNVPEEMREFAASTDPYVKSLQKGIPSNILKGLSKEKLRLKSHSTLYLPRETFSSVQTGLSPLMRVLPIWMMEKLLYKGTLTEISRRQKSTLHIQAGDELIEYNDAELNSIVKLFLEAEQDPISSIVATPQNIATQEIRSQGDIWRWTEHFQDFSEMKFRALGINESFLSSDATYANSEAGLVVFLEQLEAERSSVTRRMFYKKLFPAIAVTNNLKKDKQSRTVTAAGGGEVKDSLGLDYKMNDTSNLAIPEIIWDKKLRPQGSQEDLDRLDLLAEKGVPIGLRAIAAAGGYDIDDLARDTTLKEDQELREKIKSYTSSGGDEDDFGEFADVTRSNLLKQANLPYKRGTKLRGLNREFGALGDAVHYGTDGKKHHHMEQTRAKKGQNRNIFATLKNLSDEAHYQQVKHNNSI